MNKQYNKESLSSKIDHGMKKFIKKKPKSICQTPGCSNPCAGRKNVYCAGCIKYPLLVQNTYIPPVTVNQLPQSPPVPVNQTPLPTVNQTSLSPPGTATVTVKSTTHPPPKPTKIFSTPAIIKTKMTLLTANDSEYINIQQFFRTGLPYNTILGIFKLNMPIHLVIAHKNYRASHFSMTSLRALHGTKSICSPKRFISNPKAKFCKSGCGVCGIAQNGNKKKFSKLWFSDNSSISLGYCNGFGGAGEKAMFVIDLITNMPGPIFTLGSEA
ncbi:38631_t:CDS:2, partial [Gigaspora margarita]